jgi:hypothetical protein
MGKSRANSALIASTRVSGLLFALAPEARTGQGMLSLTVMKQLRYLPIETTARR